MKSKVILIIILLTTATISYSQNDTVPKNLSDSLVMANYLIEDGEFNKAVPYLEGVVNVKPSIENKLVLINCLINSDFRYKAIDYLEPLIEEKETKYNPEIFIETYRLLGMYYYYSYDFENAVLTYEKLINESYLDKNQMEEFSKQLKIFKNAKEIAQHPKDIYITKLRGINSKYSDHSPVISADESILMFTSRRKGSSNNKISNKDNKYFEDIYYYRLDKDIYNNKPVNIGAPINTEDHEATCGISSTGDEMFIFKTEKMDPGNIYYSKLVDDKWIKPVKLNSNINSRFRESHATISSDGQKLYFTSSRKGGYGGLDIYVSEKTENGDWGPAINLGPTINTSEAEEGPYIHPDNKTLYFSSKGHKTMGGFDVFYSNFDGTNWSEPENIGFPLNTIEDDVFLVPSSDGKRAYYASSQIDHISNIYVAYINEETENEKDVNLVSGEYLTCRVESRNLFYDAVVQNEDTLFIDDKVYYSGMISYKKDSIIKTYLEFKPKFIAVTDSICKIPDNSKVTVFHLNDIKNSKDYDISILTGKYQFVLKPGEDYLIKYTADGVIYKTKTVTTNKKGFKKFEIKLITDSIKKGKKYAKLIYTNSEQEELSNYQKLELNFVAEFAEKNPDVEIDLNFVDTANAQNNKYITKLAKEYLVANTNNSNKILFNEYTKMDTDTSKFIVDNRLLKKFVKQSEPVIAKTDVERIVFNSIHFPYNEYITYNHDIQLDSLAKVLQKFPQITIEISGHTDSKGSANFNKPLGYNRANFIKEYLISKGVEQDRIKIYTKWFSKMIANDRDQYGNYDMKLGWYNRRVEFAFNRVPENLELKFQHVPVPTQIRKSEYYSDKKDIDSSNEKLIINDVLFGYGESKNALHTQMILEIAQYLKRHTNVSIELLGHVDSDEFKNCESDLSEKRIQYIYNLLIKNGIQKNRISKSILAFNDPTAKDYDRKNKYNQDWGLYNRRVSFRFINIPQFSAIEQRKLNVPDIIAIRNEYFVAE